MNHPCSTTLKQEKSDKDVSFTFAAHSTNFILVFLSREVQGTDPGNNSDWITQLSGRSASLQKEISHVNRVSDKTRGALAKKRLRSASTRPNRDKDNNKSIPS